MAPRIERSKAPHATLIPRILHRVASPEPRFEPLPTMRCEAPDRFSFSCRHHRELSCPATSLARDATYLSLATSPAREREGRTPLKRADYCRYAGENTYGGICGLRG